MECCERTSVYQNPSSLKHSTFPLLYSTQYLFAKTMMTIFYTFSQNAVSNSTMIRQQVGIPNSAGRDRVLCAAKTGRCLVCSSICSKTGSGCANCYRSAICHPSERCVAVWGTFQRSLFRVCRGGSAGFKMMIRAGYSRYLQTDAQNDNVRVV